MDRTSWKPKVFKATEAVDYKAEEEGTSDGAKKGWLTRQRGGSAEEPKKDFTPIDWAGQVGATKSEADQDKASDLMDKYYELINEPMEDLPTDGSAMEERRSIHAKGVADFKAYLESSGSATVNQDVTDILEDENYHSLNKMLTKEEPETQSSRDKEFYDQSTQNTLDTLNQSKVNGFPFFSYVGQPKQVISDGKGGIILYGMKRNPNSIRRVDVKYDEGRDTYTVSFMSNRNKPKGEYNDVYFDQLGGLIAGNKGLGVESKANELKTYNNYNGKLNQEAQDVLRQWISTLNHSSEVDFYNIPQDVLDTVNKYTSDWMEVETFIDTISYYEEDIGGMESKANEDDHKKSWDELDSIAKKGFSDIGYDQKSWDSEPEDIRKEMETVVKGNMSKENWKDVANKFYNEELNKGKKSIGEGQHGCPFCGMSFSGSFVGHVRKNHTKEEFTQLQNDGWIPERSVYGEGLADDIEKQLNRFGVNLDRDPEQVEEAHEAYFVEWGYDLDYDFAEIDDIDEAKQKAEAEGGNVYLNDQLVYSVIPSIKKDPTNDKSNFIMGNHVMDVESKASEGIYEEYVNKFGDNQSLGGGFGDALRANDLELAFSRADTDNYNKLKELGYAWTGNESKASEDLTFAGRGELNTIQDVWNAMSNDSRYSLMYQLGHDSYGSSTVSFVNGQELTVTDMQKVIDRDEFPDHLLGNIDVEHMKRVAGLESKAKEGFYQGLYGYVDAKCKTCGIEFDSIPDMDDHYAMNSDHVSNLNDLDSDIPNSD